VACWRGSNVTSREGAVHQLITKPGCEQEEASLHTQQAGMQVRKASVQAVACRGIDGPV
jgi:hypothetical protein